MSEPVDPPYALTIQAWYVDPFPDMEYPGKGYWVAYGNYTDSRWEFAGPFLNYEARVFFPAGMDVVSPGGDVNFIVFCQSGQKVNIEHIALGSDIGFGYEETYLGSVHGSFVGDVTQIQVDENNNPHILYSSSPSMLNRDDVINSLHVADMDGPIIYRTTLDLGTIEEYRWARLAVGDGGRRAVLVQSEDPTADLFLYWDDGAGTFNAVATVGISPVDKCLAGMTFINSTDDPTGERDLLVFTYAKYTASPTTQTYYRVYDGTILGPETMLYPLTARRCGRISLCTGPDNEGVAGVPQEAGGDWRYYVGTYSAVADTWDFGTVTSWVIPEDAEWDSSDFEYRPDFIVRRADNGDIISGYLTDDDQYIRSGLWDGTTWESEPTDRVPWAGGLMESRFNLDVFSSGPAATLAPFGSMSPMLAFGLPGSGNDWFRSYLSLEPYSMIQGDLVIDDDNNVHMVCVDYRLGGLLYYHRDATTTDISTQLVDSGGEEPGYCSGFCDNVIIGDRVHLFYVDGANSRVCRSVNRSGVWEVEHENITGQFGGAPYMIYGTGYLEGDNLLWALFVDYMTMSTFCVSGPPDGSDWQVHKFSSFCTFPASAVSNDTEIGLVASTFVMGDSLPAFYHGGPRDGPNEPALITLSDSAMNYPFYLTYNEFIGQWAFAATSYDNDMVNYFLRAPNGNWIGPFIVADVSDGGGYAQVGGICVNHEDGTTRIALMYEAGGSTDAELWVYSAPNGSASFTPTSQLMVIDTITDEFHISVIAPTSNGEPLVAVAYTPGGDPTMDVRFFKESAPDAWSSLGVWDSSVMAMYLDLGLTSSGGIVVSGVEMADPDNMGRVIVYYPWE